MNARIPCPCRVLSPARPALRFRGGATTTTAQPVVSARGVVTKPKTSLVAAGIGDMPSMLGIDVGLLACLGGWFVGNYYYTLNNKLALNAAASGAPGGFPLTIGFMQFVIGSIYALFLWAAPDSREFPSVTMSDLTKILPVAACAAGQSHSPSPVPKPRRSRAHPTFTTGHDTSHATR